MSNKPTHDCSPLQLWVTERSMHNNCANRWCTSTRRTGIAQSLCGPELHPNAQPAQSMHSLKHSRPHPCATNQPLKNKSCATQQQGTNKSYMFMLHANKSIHT